MYKTYLERVKTYEDMLGCFDGPSDLSQSITVGYQAARKMIERKSVASRHWPNFIAALKSRGFEVTLEQMAEAEMLHASPTQSEENAA